MQKNFIQKHALLVSIIVVCFVFVPFVKESYGQEANSLPELTIQPPTKDEKEQTIIHSRVVLDAGHGGYDEGSQSENGAKEKDITLDITLQVGELLKESNIDVIYTRTSDKVSWPNDNAEDLLERSEIANASGADYFVSIHTNYAEFLQERITGSEVWVRHDGGENDRLATNVNKELETIDELPSRGLKDEKTSPLSLIEYNKMPSILIETGFLSNSSDSTYLSSGKGKAEVAKAIANGIIKTINEKK